MGGRGADFLGLDCGETVGGGQCEEVGRETLARLQGSDLLGLGHPGTIQELVERRIHDVGDRVPTVL